MHLMLVNDDGIRSPWLRILLDAALARGHRVTVAAPMEQQSAKAHAFTVFRPVVAAPVSLPGAHAAWAVDGTPVDCARIGLMCLTKEDPVDLVISGINMGFNAGLAVYPSGTVGAAREASFLQGRALALSAACETPEETVRHFARLGIRLAERLQRCPAPPLSVCNVNCPGLPVAELKAPVVCGLNQVIYADGYEERLSPRGDRYFWLEPERPTVHTPGRDLDLLSRGHITCTFLLADAAAPEGACADFLNELPE